MMAAIVLFSVTRRYRDRGVNQEELDYVMTVHPNYLLVTIKDQGVYYKGKPQSFTKLKMVNRQLHSVLKRY